MSSITKLQVSLAPVIHPAARGIRSRGPLASRQAVGFALLLLVLASSPAFAESILKATAGGSAIAHRDEDLGSSALTPNPGSLGITHGTAASDSFTPAFPPPDQVDVKALSSAAGTARFGALSGASRAEISVTPSFPDTTARANSVIRPGFLDTLVVESDSLAAGDPVTLLFVMTLEASAIHSTNGAAPESRFVNAAATLEAKVRDLDNLVAPVAMQFLTIDSHDLALTFRAFEFDTLIGHRIEIDVNLNIGARAEYVSGFSIPPYTQATAHVVADQTGRFFYEPSGDVTLASESGHNYAIPEPSVFAFLLAGAAVLVARRRTGPSPRRVILTSPLAGVV